MGSIFSLDGKLYKTLDKLADCLILNLLWLLCCIPIATIGAANTALYYTTQKVLRKEEGSVWSTYWRTFRSNFKQGTILGIIFLVLMTVLGLDLYFAYILEGSLSVMRVFYVLIPIILLVVLTWSIYCFAYIAHIEDRLGTVLKNCFLICITNLPRVILLAGGYILCLLLLIFVSFGPMLILVLPAAYMYLIVCPTLETVFSKYWDMDQAVETSEISEE